MKVQTWQARRHHSVVPARRPPRCHPAAAYPTMGEGEMQGAVKISAAGLRELRELGEDGE